MADLLLGALAVAVRFFLSRYAGRRQLSVVRWQWALPVLNLACAVFAIEMILAFLEEGSPKAAIVVGSILGFGAVVWAVLLLRFVVESTAGPRSVAGTADVGQTDRP